MLHYRSRKLSVLFFALLLFLTTAVVGPARGAGEVAPEQRIAQILRQIAVNGQEGRTSSEIDDLLHFSKDRSRVAVRVMASDVIFLLPLLEGYDFELLGADPDRHLVEGFLPIDQLLAVSSLTSVGLRGVVPVYRPVTDTGSVTSEADVVHEAARVRATMPGYDGSGITIGTLSDSFNAQSGAAADEASGDLPPLASINVIEDYAGGSDEGRAMIQLMYDVAPGAGYAFATAFTGSTNFADNIRALASGGADVIVDDVVYFNEPFFQDGIIAEAVNDVHTNDGVAYFSSAGNRDTRAYESTNFNASSHSSTGLGTVTAHDFDSTGAIDTRQGLTLASGERVRLALQWDDPFYTSNGVDTDLDLYLLDGSGAVVAQSADPSDDINYPFEFLAYTNGTGATAIFDVVIVLADGPAPGRLKYVNFGDDISGIEYDTNSPTVNPHAAAEGAQAVAAAFYADHFNPEPFTSRGPSTFLFDAAGNMLGTPEVRQTPNYAAVDGVNNTFFGSSDNESDGNPNFFGTSAAAPHAAALAALIRQANPGLSPAQVYDALANSATDIASSGAGFDNVTGAGLINVYDALYPIEPTSLNLAFSDDLEAGFLSSVWETRTSGPGRILVTPSNGPNGGSYHVTMDTFAAFGFGLNELILHLDLRSGTNMTLEFYQKESFDQDHPMSATFTGSENSDGVALSVDGGTTWYRLVDLTGANSTSSYQLNSINLSTFASANGLTLGEDVRITFQQYGLFSFPNDGFAFDDIQVTSSTPTAVTLGAVQTGYMPPTASWSSWAILLLLALGLAGVGAAALTPPRTLS